MTDIENIKKYIFKIRSLKHKTENIIENIENQHLTVYVFLSVEDPKYTKFTIYEIIDGNLQIIDEFRGKLLTLPRSHPNLFYTQEEADAEMEKRKLISL